MLFKINILATVPEEYLGQLFSGMHQMQQYLPTGSILTGVPIPLDEAPEMESSDNKNGILDLIDLAGKSTVHRNEIREMIVNGGKAKGSTNYAIKRLIDEKVLRKTKKLGVYKVKASIANRVRVSPNGG